MRCDRTHITYFEDENKKVYAWQCRRYLLCRGVFKMDVVKCYDSRCKGRKEIKNICAWKDCTRLVGSIDKGKQRHCSEVCRKKQNRYDYRVRKGLING